MALNRIVCPECGAAMKSAAGFKVGKKVTCAKCDEEFVVEEPEEEQEEEEPRKAKATSGKRSRDEDNEPEVEEEEEERPKKKKKKKRREESAWQSYKNSWIRYAILTVLIIIMCVLGYMLYLKRERERATLETEPRIRTLWMDSSA